MRRLLPALLLLALALPARADPGAVAGRVLLQVEGVPLAEVGPTVVFLESLDGAGGGEVPAVRHRIRQRDAHFDPDFLAIAAGETIDMPNEDAIFHNVFSFSKPNQFDLGLYPAGESRSVRFRHPGVVKIYCSIHESMSATVFVAPTAWLVVAAPSGEFSLRDVPAGRYRVHVWNERLPEASRTVEVQGGREVRVEIALALAAP
jgi:plastocyanin